MYTIFTIPFHRLQCGLSSSVSQQQPVETHPQDTTEKIDPNHFLDYFKQRQFDHGDPDAPLKRAIYLWIKPQLTTSFNPPQTLEFSPGILDLCWIFFKKVLEHPNFKISSLPQLQKQMDKESEQKTLVTQAATRGDIAKLRLYQKKKMIDPTGDRYELSPHAFPFCIFLDRTAVLLSQFFHKFQITNSIDLRIIIEYYLLNINANPAQFEYTDTLSKYQEKIRQELGQGIQNSGILDLYYSHIRKINQDIEEISSHQRRLYESFLALQRRQESEFEKAKSQHQVLFFENAIPLFAMSCLKELQKINQHEILERNKIAATQLLNQQELQQQTFSRSLQEFATEIPRRLAIHSLRDQVFNLLKGTEKLMTSRKRDLNALTQEKGKEYQKSTEKAQRKTCHRTYQQQFFRSKIRYDLHHPAPQEDFERRSLAKEEESDFRNLLSLNETLARLRLEEESKTPLAIKETHTLLQETLFRNSLNKTETNERKDLLFLQEILARLRIEEESKTPLLKRQNTPYLPFSPLQKRWC